MGAMRKRLRLGSGSWSQRHMLQVGKAAQRSGSL